MKTFNHGDFVVSVTQKDVTLEAQVDFEDDNGKVYISEWGRNLNNPMRIVLDKKYLIKKDKKVILHKKEFEKLILEYYPTPALVEDLDKEVEVTDGYVTMMDARKLEYITPFGEDKYLFRVLNRDTYTEKDDSYYLVSNSELQQGVVHLKDVLQYIFGTDDKDLFEIILDDNQNENEENL